MHAGARIMVDEIGKNIVATVAIVMLALIEITALVEHEDGAYISIVVGAITAVIGYVFGKKIGLKQSKGG